MIKIDAGDYIVEFRNHFIRVLRDYDEWTYRIHSSFNDGVLGTMIYDGPLYCTRKIAIAKATLAVVQGKTYENTGRLY